MYLLEYFVVHAIMLFSSKEKILIQLYTIKFYANTVTHTLFKFFGL